MVNINKYINGLLFMHDCVILPGFGGFISNYHCAEHEELSNTFHPPKKDILFNQNLTYNDGLLINYISRNQKIPYKEAELLVKKEVEDVWVSLEENNEVVFEGVGTFILNKGKLNFTPILKENFLAESYGLSSFRFPPLNYEKGIRKINSNYNSTEMNSGLKQTLKWTAIAIPIIGILALIPYVKDNNQQVANIGYGIDSVKDQPIEKTHSAMVPDSNVSGMINQATDKRKALFYTEQNLPTIKKQDTQNKTFYIIGASYKSKENAQTHANKYKINGYDAEIIESNNLYRVSMASFDSKVNALHELRRIRNENKNEKVWLFAN